MSPGPGRSRATGPRCRGASRGQEISDHEDEADGGWVVHPGHDRLVADRGVSMHDRGDLSDHQSTRIAATDAAGAGPLAARGGDSDLMLDLELKRRRPTGDRALQGGLRKKDVHAALWIRKRLHDCAVRAGLLHASEEPGACRHDHARPHAVRGSTVDLQGAAEPVWAATDELRTHHVVA